MKRQASLEITIVADPIDDKALPGHFALRANQNGLYVIDENGNVLSLDASLEQRVKSLEDTVGVVGELIDQSLEVATHDVN